MAFITPARTLYARCHISGLPGIDRIALTGREALVFAWYREQGIPATFGIGGGYINAEFQRAELVDLHRLTLYSALDQVDSPA
jgi:hypothetical protein